METSIIVAIITGLCAVLGQWLIARDNKRKSDTEQAVKDAIFQQKLETLTAKVEEHNGYARMFSETAERLGRIEQRLEDMQ